LLVDRVIVTDEEVEIRYVVPTDPSNEKVRFCHLRSDYLHYPPTRQHPEPARLLLQSVAPQLPVLMVRHFDPPT
ncbi:MAG: hypothetical protein M3392_11475, partial [Actinomycetota bacterium]|nr:hypothetical protein [Actinomycetota bacterium]